MSMHDIESFAENAILFVAQLDLPADEKILLIHNIYRFQNAWDTGFTKLRVYDSLIDTGYWFAFMPAEHPDYLAYKELFGSLGKKIREGSHFALDCPSAGLCRRCRTRQTRSGIGIPALQEAAVTQSAP